MKITREDVLRVAELAHLQLSEAEIESMSQHLDTILTYSEKLNELNTDAVEPMAQVVPPGARGASVSAGQAKGTAVIASGAPDTAAALTGAAVPHGAVADSHAGQSAATQSQLETTAAADNHTASSGGARPGTPLREDVPLPCDIIGEVLAGAPDPEPPYFRVPKVIDR